MFQVYSAWVEKGIYDRAPVPFQIVNISAVYMSTLQNYCFLNISLACSVKEIFISFKMLLDYFTNNTISFISSDNIKSHHKSVILLLYDNLVT